MTQGMAQSGTVQFGSGTVQFVLLLLVVAANAHAAVRSPCTPQPNNVLSNCLVHADASASKGRCETRQATTTNTKSAADRGSDATTSTRGRGCPTTTNTATFVRGNKTKISCSTAPASRKDPSTGRPPTWRVADQATAGDGTDADSTVAGHMGSMNEINNIGGRSGEEQGSVAKKVSFASSNWRALVRYVPDEDVVRA